MTDCTMIGRVAVKKTLNSFKWVVSRNIQRKPSSLQTSNAAVSNESGNPGKAHGTSTSQSRTGGKAPRPGVNTVRVRKVKGKKGIVKEQHDLIVNIDLDLWDLSMEQVADLKEVFMLYDMDEDGVLNFNELEQVMLALGQRPENIDLLQMVREVSEDHAYDTIEFNEFLQLMSKEMNRQLTNKDLVDAFRTFDKKGTGKIDLHSVVKLLTKMGTEVEEFIKMAEPQNGMIDYKDFCSRLLPELKGGKVDHGTNQNTA